MKLTAHVTSIIHTELIWTSINRICDGLIQLRITFVQPLAYVDLLSKFGKHDCEKLLYLKSQAVLHQENFTSELDTSFYVSIYVVRLTFDIPRERY